MKYPVNLKLFRRNAHSPSHQTLKLSMGNSNCEILDFCIPINSYFPTHNMLQKYADNLYEILKYYPSDSGDLSKIVAKVFGYDPECLLLFNGSTELITYINVFFVNNSICSEIPTFGRWVDQPQELGKRIFQFEAKEEDNYRVDPEEYANFVLKSGADIAVICNPNNPTGSLLSHSEMVNLLDRLKSIDLIIVDEAFIDFSYPDPRDIPSMAHEAMRRDNVIVVKSLGKNLGLHGVRLGYAIAPACIIKKLNTVTPKWNINGIAEAVIRDLADNFDLYESARKKQIQDRFYLEDQLKQFSHIKVFPSTTNFVYLKLPDNIDGYDFRNRMIGNHGCFIRECGNKVGSSSQYIRIAVCPKDKVDILIQALKEEL